MSQTMIQLSDNPLLDRRHKEVLAKIRQTYGNTTQILVSNEELCELAAVCAKFPRYTDPEKARSELHSAAVDEVADVMIVLDHIISIFGLHEDEVRDRISGKVDRITRWLSESNSQEQTTIDREVHVRKSRSIPCGNCAGFRDFNNLKPGHRCWVCVNSNYSKFELKSEDKPEDQVRWSKSGKCPVTPEKFEEVWEESDGNDS